MKNTAPNTTAGRPGKYLYEKFNPTTDQVEKLKNRLADHGKPVKWFFDKYLSMSELDYRSFCRLINWHQNSTVPILMAITHFFDDYAMVAN